MRGRTRWTTIAIVAALAAAGTAEAKTFEVTRTNDPVPNGCKKKDCSLREAVIRANASAGRDVIVVPNAKKPYRLTRAGASEDAALTGDLDVLNGALVIKHPGGGKATIDANGIDRVLNTYAGASLTIAKLRLTGGDTTVSGGDGGAIDSEAEVTIKGSVIAGNVADNVGGAIDMGAVGDLLITNSVLRDNEALNTAGAIRSGSGAIAIRNSRLIGNKAAGDGGAIRLGGPQKVVIAHSTISGNESSGDGGGIQSDSDEPLVIKQTTIAGNRALEGGGLIAEDPGVVRITGSTISRNRAVGPAGSGGGLYFSSATATITNSTIAHNRSQTTGGGIQTSDIATQLSLNAVTVARNKADHAGAGGTEGGGLHNEDSQSFEVRNSVIALNFSDTTRNDCEGNLFQSLGNNLLSTGFECDGFNVPGDLIRNNPKLAKLKRNGGPTKTIALRKGSPAIGKAHKPSAPKRDQRGRKRDRKPDIGAYERGA